MGLLVFFQLALADGNFLENHVCTYLPVIWHVLTLALCVAIVGCQARTFQFCCRLPTYAIFPVFPLLRLESRLSDLALPSSLPYCIYVGGFDPFGVEEQGAILLCTPPQMSAILLCVLSVVLSPVMPYLF